MRLIKSICLVVVLMIGLTACGEEEAAELPPPATLTQEAIGYYCNMTVADHQGPKGQIRLKSQSEPVWFSSVRDTIAFTLLPEEPKDIAAIYVTDMSEAGSWENPDASKWIDARTAHYVMGSSMRGGMGAPEAAPFGTREAAEMFAHQHGGHIVAFSEIPKDSILGMVEVGGEHGDMSQEGMSHGEMSHEGMSQEVGHENMKMESGG